MSENKTYYDWLFNKTEEEIELNKLYLDELSAFEKTPEYLAHRERLNAIGEKRKEATRRRMEEGRKHRPHREPLVKLETTSEQISERRKREFEALPQNIKDVVNAYNSLDENEQKLFNDITLVRLCGLDEFENPQTTKKELKELLEILVQTTIDFINERNLKDIEEINFSVDGLQDSAKESQWTPSSDASIHAVGIDFETTKNGQKIPVRKEIGNIY